MFIVLYRIFLSTYEGTGAPAQGLIPAGWTVREAILAGLSVLLAVGLAALLVVLARGRKARQARLWGISNEVVERLQLAFEFAPDAYYLTDFSGRFVDGNRAVEALLGYSREELIGRHILALKLLSPDQHAKAAAIQSQHARGESTGPDEFTLNRKDGTQVCVEINTYPVVVDEQTLVLGIARDITGRKEVEQENRRLREFNESIIQNVVEGIVVVGAQGRIDFVNPAAAQMIGYQPEELVGCHWTYVIPSDQYAIVEAADERRLQGIADRYELRLLHRDGSRVPVIVSGAPRYDQGQVMGSLAVFMDIRARKQAEETLLKLRNAVEASGDAIFMTDRQGIITYVNPRFTEMYGWPAEEVVGQVTPRILKSGLVEPEQYEYFWKTLLDKQVVKGELINRAKDGSLIHIAGSANPILDDQDEIIGFLAIQGDITERVRAEAAERAARQLAEERAAELHILERAAQALNQAGTLGDPLEPALERIMELVEADSGWVVLLEESDGTRLAAARGLPQELKEDDNAPMEWFGCTCQRKLLSGELTVATNLMECDRLVQVNGGSCAGCQHATIPLRIGNQALGNLNLIPPSGQTFSDQQLRLLTAIGAQFSVAIERARLFGEVQQLAITDSLTGLYNRRHFFTLSRHEFDRSRRYQRPLAVLMLDLDHFKRVNDTYGHAVGDMVLQEVAARCQGTLRKVDILSRYGGEEFAVLLPETDLGGARNVAERLRRNLVATPIETERGLVSVTASFGVASMDERCLVLDELLERADMALYRAKQAGRDQVSTAS